jgi:alkanesulfonate monooxygenase SsuD/methylene tetrahydromethanopterin reductase-like flavin-dependent oxidoreductase (luciferase family)
VRLGCALGAHTHDFETLVELVRHAEALGYEVAHVDGDVSMMARRTDAPVLDGWTVTLALLDRTERIAVTSLRLPHHWNAARLAQAAATAHRIHGDRFRFAITAGAQPSDRRFGLDYGTGAERVARLEETVEAVRALWRGEAVTRAGRFVRLEGARVAPTPPGGALPVEIAGRGRRLMSVVAAHADRWDVNWPPIRARVERAGGWLARACAARGRDPGTIERSQWIFTRLVDGPPEPAREAVEAEFRERNPWFAKIGAEELAEGLVWGDAARCGERVMEIRQVLGIDLPILDLTGLDAPATRRTLEALAPTSGGGPAPAANVVDPGESRT